MDEVKTKKQALALITPEPLSKDALKSLVPEELSQSNRGGAVEAVSKAFVYGLNKIHTVIFRQKADYSGMVPVEAARLAEDGLELSTREHAHLLVLAQINRPTQYFLAIDTRLTNQPSRSLDATRANPESPAIISEIFQHDQQGGSQSLKKATNITLNYKIRDPEGAEIVYDGLYFDRELSQFQQVSNPQTRITETALAELNGNSFFRFIGSPMPGVL